MEGSVGACSLKSTPLGPTFKDAAGVIQAQAVVPELARRTSPPSSSALADEEDLSPEVAC